jgi:hypothetical protein
MVCLLLVSADISSDDTIQLMLTGPTYLHFDATAVLTFVSF